MAVVRFIPVRVNARSAYVQITDEKENWPGLVALTSSSSAELPGIEDAHNTPGLLQRSMSQHDSTSENTAEQAIVLTAVSTFI